MQKMVTFHDNNLVAEFQVVQAMSDENASTLSQNASCRSWKNYLVEMQICGRNGADEKKEGGSTHR